MSSVFKNVQIQMKNALKYSKISPTTQKILFREIGSKSKIG